MPSPHKVVSKSLTHLQGRGYGLSSSLATVALAAESAIEILAMAGVDDVHWLEAISQEAYSRQRLLDPSHANTTGGEYADGSSSSASRPAGHQET